MNKENRVTSKTQKLIETLKTMDTTLARVWDNNCEAAFEDQAAYRNLSGRQQSQVDQLRAIDRAFAAGRIPTDELYIISDGAFKTF